MGREKRSGQNALVHGSNLVKIVACLINCLRLCDVANHWCECNLWIVKRARGKPLECSFSWIMSSLSFLAAPVSLSHGFSVVIGMLQKQSYWTMTLGCNCFIEIYHLVYWLCYFAAAIVHQNAHKGSNVVFSCLLFWARDRRPCRAHYSAGCEWGVMPSIAGLFCRLRSRIGIPLEEKKQNTCNWFVKRIKGGVILQYSKCFVRHAVLYVNLILSSTQLQLHRHRPKSGVASRGTVQDLQLTHRLTLRGVNQVNGTECRMLRSHCCVVSELNYRPRKMLLPPQV